MKKLLGLLPLFISTCLYGQIVVSGTVTFDTDGKPVVGARVSSKGEFYSTCRTDRNGNYSLEVANDAKTLKVVHRNIPTIVVPITGRTVDIIISGKAVSKPANAQPDSLTKRPGFISIPDPVKSFSGFDSVLSDHGYEIRSPLSNSTAFIQTLEGSAMNPSHSNLLPGILAGKIAGLKYYGQSEMSLNAEGAVTLRGQGGFGTNRSPVYIVDGTEINNISYLDYNEIESVTILPGPAYAALIGSRAIGGAILVTTKKAPDSGEQEKIELNSSARFSSVYQLPAYQDSYAGGAFNELRQYNYRPGYDPVEWAPLDGKYYHDYGDDSSWGPKMTGQEYIPWYSWYPGTKYTGTTAKLVPQKDNVRDFYETGFETSNTVSVSKRTGKLGLRVSAGNRYYSGLLPASFRSSVFFSFNVKTPIKKRLFLNTSLRYVYNQLNGDFDNNYGSHSSGMFNSWFHRDLDMGIMKDLTSLRSPQGYYASWDHNSPLSYDPVEPRFFYIGNYWINPYAWFGEAVRMPSHINNLTGSMSLTVNLIKGLDMEVTYRENYLSDWAQEKFKQTNYSSLSGNEPRSIGYFYTSNGMRSAGNLEGILRLNRKFGGFTLNVNTGADIYSYISKFSSEHTNGGLIVPDLFSINNSKDDISVENTKEREIARSLFFQADLGYKDYAFLDLVFRNEYRSTLPANSNPITSGSIGGSFIFTRLLKLPLINNGKLRISYGVIPSAIGIYAYPGITYSQSSHYWSVYPETTGDYCVSKDIKGSMVRQAEAGMDLEFLDGRIGFSFTRWNGSETGIPVTVHVSDYSGFSYKMINSGEIKKSGTDLALNIVPVKGKAIAWNTGIIFSWLTNNKVTRVADNLDMLSIGATRWGPAAYIEKGRQWGQLVGPGMKTDSKGLPYLTSMGTYVSDPYKHYGSILPNLTGGIRNSLKFFSRFALDMDIDFQRGGKFFSLSDMWGTYSGITAWTAGLNDKGKPVRDPVADGGGVHVSGISIDTGNPVDYYIEAAEYFHNLYDFRIFDFFVYDASYIKLRGLSISYSLPLEKFKNNKVVKEAFITAFAQNPLMIWASQRDFDPSELTYIYGENAMLPSVRSYGMNLKLVF